MNNLHQLPRACARSSITRQPQAVPARLQLLSRHTRSLSSSTAPNANTTVQSTSPLDSVPSPELAQPNQQRTFVAHVSRTDTMAHTIQLTRTAQMYDAHLRKNYTRPQRLLAHDPNPPRYLREGDVVEYSAWTGAEKAERQTQHEARLARELEKARAADGGKEDGKNVRRVLAARERDARERVGKKTGKGPQWVVRRVVTPFGTSLEDRFVG